MPAITTANLRSEDFYRDLVIPALNVNSVVLRNLNQITTEATKVNIPRVGDASVGWVAEGAALPDAGLAPDLVTVTPKKVAAYSDLSNESLSDAGSLEIAGEAMARALARAVDRAFFVSGGTDAPTPLETASALVIDAIPTSGVDPYIDAVAQMENAGASPSVIFMNPLDWGALAKVKETTGSAKPVLSGDSGPTAAATRSLNGLPVEVSPGVPQGTAYVVDGSRTAAVIRKDGTVEADSSAGFRNDVTVVRVVGRFGFGHLYQAAVARIRDVV